MKKLTTITTTLLLLSSCTTECVFWCHDGTEIQSRYVDTRDECQQTAQLVVSATAPPGTPKKERNTRLLEAFAKCMKAKNWAVTSPKKTNSRPGGPNDNSNLSGDPWAPTPYAVRQAPPQQPAQQQGYNYPQQGYSPAYNPYPQGYQQQQPQQYQQPAYQRAAPQPYYQQQVPTYQPQNPNYGYGAADNNASFEENSNRAGIGLGPGY